jgi:hypothetical protein
MDNQTPTDKSVILDGIADAIGESEAWTARFDHLPVYLEGGSTKILYTVKETSSSSGYTLLSDDSVLPDGTITNIPTSSIEVKKVWVSNDVTQFITESQSGSISFRLFQRAYTGDGKKAVERKDIPYPDAVCEDTEGVSQPRPDKSVFMIQAQKTDAPGGGYSWPTVKIKDLPLCDGTYTFRYYIQEISGGVSVDYAYIPENDPTEPEDLPPENWKATFSDVEATSGSICMRNQLNSYEMPSTGGEGQRRIYLSALFLLLIAGIGYSFKKARKKEI